MITVDVNVIKGNASLFLQDWNVVSTDDPVISLITFLINAPIASFRRRKHIDDR